AARLAGSATEVTLDGPSVVAPGSSARLRVTLTVDCARPARGELELLASPADGRTHRVRPPGLGRGLGMTPADTVSFCRQQRYEQIPVWRTWVEDDGSLGIQVRNLHDRDVTLTVATPAGTSVRGDPALPVTLASRRSSVVHLYLDV